MPCVGVGLDGVSSWCEFSATKAVSGLGVAKCCKWRNEEFKGDVPGASWLFAFFHLELLTRIACAFLTSLTLG